MTVPYYTSPDGLWRARGRDPLPPLGDSGYVPGWGFPVWRDEFTGPSIDLSKWTVRDHSTHGSLSYDWGYIRSANAQIVDGALRLRTSKRTTPINASGRIRNWDTAYLDTMGKFEQTFGRWEMRAKLPTLAEVSQGVWPAFWLRNGDVGEIDIMESWGDKPKNRSRNVNLTETSTATLHQSTNGGGQSYGTTYEHRVNGGGGLRPYSTARGYHTWALEFTPNYLRFLFDGVITADIRRDGDRHPIAGANATRDFSWVWGSTFMDPWAIRLNAQMGDPYWSSDTDPATGALTASMPADFTIAHIRAWALPA